MVKNPVKGVTRCRCLVEYLAELQIINNEKRDYITADYKKFVENPGLKSFYPILDRMDDFFFVTMNIEKLYPIYADLSKIIFCLSHGQE